MKITRISAYQVDLPRDRVYRLSSGQTTSVFDTTVVRVETDVGLTGLGEICPFGRVYLPAYAAGARTGLAELAPQLIGLDPREPDVVNAAIGGDHVVVRPNHCRQCRRDRLLPTGRVVLELDLARAEAPLHSGIHLGDSDHGPENVFQRFRRQRG